MKRRKFILFVVAGILLLFLPNTTHACGGRLATVVDNPEKIAASVGTFPSGETFYIDHRGDYLLEASQVKISSGLAEAVARKYLERTYPEAKELEFEAFTFEHGAFVYMFDTHIPGSAVSYHVGPVRYATDHFHFHVDATTGDVYGLGCGGGPGKVVMKYDPAEYPAELKDKKLPLTQFDASFVAREGSPPRLDGVIDPDEWRDAAHKRIHVGVNQSKLTDYGCGTSGQSVVSDPTQYSLDVWTKIHEGAIYFAVRADTTNWIAMLFKDFEHHGMIGDFNDAKLLARDGIGDYFLTLDPGVRTPRPRFTAGVHS
jgi:hypothetical protein